MLHAVENLPGSLADPTTDMHAALEHVYALLPGFLEYDADQSASWRDWWKPGDPANKHLLPDGIQPDGTIVVTISPPEYMLATMIGSMRQGANRNASNSKGYSGGVNNAERIAQPNAVLCELAVARHLGLPFNLADAIWARNQHQRNRGGADLAAHNVEVRSVRERQNRPWIKHKDVPKPNDARKKWIYIAYPLGIETYQVQILGHLEVREMWRLSGKPTGWDNPNSNRGVWNPETGDRQLGREAELRRCSCRNTGQPGYTQHPCQVAVNDLPTDYRDSLSLSRRLR